MRITIALLLFVLLLGGGVETKSKGTIITTEEGQFSALVGKDLPDFVKRAAELVPSSAIPANFGAPLLDRIVVVTDALGFAKAMGIKDLHVICVELNSKTIYVLKDHSLVNSDPENPLSWVIRAEEEWKAARLKQVADRGMTYLMAAMLTHEIGHVSRNTTDQEGANELTLELLDTFARQGKVSADLVHGYRAVLFAANDRNPGSK